MQLKYIKEENEKRRRFERWTSIDRKCIWNNFETPQAKDLGIKCKFQMQTLQVHQEMFQIETILKHTKLLLYVHRVLNKTLKTSFGDNRIVALVMFPGLTGQSSGQLNFPHKVDIFRSMFLKRRHLLFFKSLDSLRAERLFQKQSTRWF